MPPEGTRFLDVAQWAPYWRQQVGSSFPTLDLWADLEDALLALPCYVEGARREASPAAAVAKLLTSICQALNRTARH